MFGLAPLVLQSPTKALSISLLIAALAAIFSPLGFLLSGIIALVYTKSIQTGSQVLVLSALVAFVVSYLLTGNSLSGSLLLMEFILPVGLMAYVFEKTSQFNKAMESGIWLAVVLGVLAFAYEPNQTQWWTNQLQWMMQPVISQSEPELAQELQSFITNFAPYMTSVMVFALLSIWYAGFVWGTYWSSKIMAPGQFRLAFVRFTLSKVLAALTIIALIFTLISEDAFTGLAGTLATIGIFAFMIQGMAVVHYQAGVRNWSKFWMVIFYVLLGFFPQVMLMVAFLGILDLFKPLRNAPATSL